MIRTDKLKGIMAQQNISQCNVAKAIGITPKTFYAKMKKGVFGSDEIDAMIRILNIKDPADIFFAKE